MLILLEGLQEGSKDELEIGQELRAGLLFKCSKRAARRLLNTLVRIQHSLQQLEGRGQLIGGNIIIHDIIDRP